MVQQIMYSKDDDNSEQIENDHTLFGRGDTYKFVVSAGASPFEIRVGQVVVHTILV